MSTVVYTGNAPTQAQVSTYTPASVGVGNTFTLTCNGKTVSFVATAATAANVTAGLYALLTDTDVPPPTEFSDVDWTDNTGTLVATSSVAGRPFTITSSASGGTATFSASATTANSGPNDISIGSNWSGGSVPSSSDTMVFENSSNDILYGLDFSSMSNAAIYVDDTFTGNFGLPETNAAGYKEYRGTYLKCGAITLQFSGTASRAKFDLGSSNVTATINSTGTSPDFGIDALLIKTTGTLAITVNGDSSVGVGIFAGETVGNITAVVNGGTVRLGTQDSNHTVTSLTMLGGEVQTAGSMTGSTLYGGTLTHLIGTIGTLTNFNATAIILAGTITTCVNTATIDWSQSGAAKTVSAATAYAGSSWIDPGARVSWSTGITLSRCRISDITIDFGRNRLITIT